MIKMVLDTFEKMYSNQHSSVVVNNIFKMLLHLPNSWTAFVVILDNF